MKQLADKATVKRDHSWIVEHPNDIDHPIIPSSATQALYGEYFDIEKTEQGWAKGKLVTDGYEGWISISDLAPLQDQYQRPNAYCTALSSFIYGEPDLKSRPISRLCFMSQLTLNPDQHEGHFIATHDGGWVHAKHIIAHYEVKEGPEAFETARRFIGAPYLYGGRSIDGIDCSALIQLCFARKGVKLPRDSTPQKDSEKGGDIKMGMDDQDTRTLSQGHVVFFPGHVGIMATDETIIHAFSDAMMVREDPVADIAAFYKEKQGAGITAIRRF